MYCSKCGAQIDDDSVFCKECGYKMKKDDEGNIDNQPLILNIDATKDKSSSNSPWGILGLVIGILTLLGIPLARARMGGIRGGFIFAGIALIGFALSLKKDDNSKGVRTAAQVICLISIVINGLIAFAISYSSGM